MDRMNLSRIRLFSWTLLVLLLPALLGSAPAAHAEEEKQAKKPKPQTVAVFTLDNPVTDKPTPDDPLFGTIGAESLRSLVSRIEKAGDDEDVAAVVVLMGSTSLGVGQSEELRKVLDAVKGSKPVYAHADSISTKTYALLAGASRLSLAPTGDAWINGLYGERIFLRGLLDLIGVQPDFLTCGEYKSAAEMFMLKGPSEESAEMDNWLFDSLFESIQTLIAEGRGVEREQVQKWIDEGLYSAESALQAGLVDAVETREDLTAVIKKEHGVTVKFEKSYAKKSGPDLDLNNPFAALQIWMQILGGPQQRRSTKDAIAIVHVDGPIMLGKPDVSPFGSTEGAYSERIRKALDELADDPRVKGVVLRVNSPGGSATASEIILQAARRVQERKPVVVSMGNVAASGGYYVSSRADRIFANPSTVTGSIGVVAGKLATQQMWGRIGIHFEPIERGKKSGILYSGRPFKEEEREDLQAWMDSIYEVFQRHVVEGRDGKLTQPIDELAGGRVYTGAQALERGLVDELGTLEDAIAYVVAKTELEDYEIRTVPRAQNFMEQLFADLAPRKEKDDRRLSAGLWSSIEPMLQGLDPHRVAMIREAIGQLDFLNEEKVMLTIPVFRIRD
jgi:protease IV